VTGAACQAVGVGVIALAAACAVSPTDPGESDGSIVGSDAAAFQTELVFCADQVNSYRRSVGLQSLVRSPPLELYAASAAEVDGAAHLPHVYFAATNGGGVSRAETEILWWRGFSVHAAVRDGLAQMWRVGPGGEHYDIMAGPYTEIGCGIFVSGGEVTVAQDFR
jgi:hypothetical protein